LAVGVGAYWLAGSAVAPVLEVAEQARVINPDSGTKQITTHTDISEYQSLISVFNDLLTRCDRAFNAQRRLTADLGHELRTPLTALRGEMEIALRSERSPQRYQDVLRSGLEEIDRLTGMCDALLLITQADSHTLSLHRSPTDVNSLMLHSVDKMQREVERRGITVTTSFLYSGEPPLLDADLTARMVAELVENAVNHSPERGRITLGTSRGDAHVRLWVQDSGTGIAPEHLPYLFDAFFRADEARTRSTATGLGLTLAASLARIQGGMITAANVPGSGARFEIDLHVSAPQSSGAAAA
jgi:signal transduction histidine kinase